MKAIGRKRTWPKRYIHYVYYNLIIEKPHAIISANQGNYKNKRTIFICIPFFVCMCVCPKKERLAISKMVNLNT